MVGVDSSGCSGAALRLRGKASEAWEGRRRRVNRVPQSRGRGGWPMQSSKAQAEACPLGVGGYPRVCLRCQRGSRRLNRSSRWRLKSPWACPVFRCPRSQLRSGALIPPTGHHRPTPLIRLRGRCRGPAGRPRVGVAPCLPPEMVQSTVLWALPRLRPGGGGAVGGRAVRTCPRFDRGRPQGSSERPGGAGRSAAPALWPRKGHGGWGRASFEQGGEGGRGLWTQNLVYQK